MQTPVNNSVIWAWRIGLVVTGLSFWEYGSGRWFSPLFASRPSLIVAQFWDGSRMAFCFITRPLQSSRP
jgi:ABC-type nitrate/sulfonate/bicarbonate transport system permease component